MDHYFSSLSSPTVKLKALKHFIQSDREMDRKGEKWREKERERVLEIESKG